MICRKKKVFSWIKGFRYFTLYLRYRYIPRIFMSFLTAEWKKLTMANYLVEPAVLAPYVPAGTELDYWQGRCYVSLVGFMFLKTRLLGVSVPFHSDFEEVNLRFYVRCRQAGTWRRGVVFIKEIVPKPALSFVANTVYGENYETMWMSHQWEEFSSHQTVEYQWSRAHEKNRLYVEADLSPVEIPNGSEAEFITEHYWGYTRVSDTHTSEYEVKHPKWRCYPVTRSEVEVDFGSIYGKPFAKLSELTPLSVILAEGSHISVEKKRTLSSARV